MGIPTWATGRIAAGSGAVVPHVTQLNQIIAITRGVKSKAERDLTDVYHRLQKPALLAGIARSYTPKDEDGQQMPAESTRVQLDVETALGDVRAALSRLFDVQATLDWSNCAARASVMVEGQTILEDVPVSYLLFLDRQLTGIRTLISKLPTLDPADEWSRDEAQNAWATPPTQTLRTKKLPRNHVLAAATDKHPAQVQVYMEDVAEGTWTQRKFSGALPETRRRELLDRVDRLIAAVKYAREEANTAEVDDQKIAKYVFDYLLA